MADDLNTLIQDYQEPTYRNEIMRNVIGSSKPLSLNDVIQTSDSNFSSHPGTFITPNTDIRQHPMSLNASGLTFNKAPNTIFVGQNGKRANTIAHESAHVQQHMNNQLESYKPDTQTKWSILDKAKNLKTQELVDALKDGSGRAKDLSFNMDDNLSELGATFSGLEATMPKGHLVWDHPKLKGVFTPDEQAHIERYMNSAYDKVKESPTGAQEHAMSVDWIRLMQRNIRNWTAK